MSLQSFNGLLILLCGLPGVGKTTLARRLAAHLAAYPVTILQSDRVRKEMFPQPTYSPQESEQVHRAIRARAARLLQQREIVIYDATNLSRYHRLLATAPARQTNARRLIIEVVAAEQVVQARLAARPRDPSDLSDATLRVYQLLRAEAEAVQEEHLTYRGDDETRQEFRRLARHLQSFLPERLR